MCVASFACPTTVTWPSLSRRNACLRSRPSLSSKRHACPVCRLGQSRDSSSSSTAQRIETASLPKIPATSSQPSFPPSSAPLARDLYFLLNHPVVEVVSAGLVLGQCAVFALETVGFGGVVDVLLRAYERGISALFVVEYFLRWYSVGLKPRFLLTKMMLIDFCAVLLPLGLALTPYVGKDGFSALFVRALRFARVFQLQRVLDEERTQNTILGSVPTSRKRLANVFLTVFTLLYISAGLFYDFESGVNPEVTNMFAALYWSINTFLTVGPGDVVPITAAGRITSTATVLIGAVLVPLQLSEIVSAAMQAQFETDVEAQKASRPTKRTPVNSPSSVSRETFALSGDVDPPDLPPEFFSQDRGARRTEDITSYDSQVSLFDFDAECPRCHLRVHQHDARFCRNCAAPLRKKMFDD